MDFTIGMFVGISVVFGIIVAAMLIMNRWQRNEERRERQEILLREREARWVRPRGPARRAVSKTQPGDIAPVDITSPVWMTIHTPTGVDDNRPANISGGGGDFGGGGASGGWSNDCSSRDTPSSYSSDSSSCSSSSDSGGSSSSD
jgi:hypothetical protein